MAIKVQDFKISFGSQLIYNDNLSIPFRMVMQTSSKKIETQLKEKWPEFLTSRILNIQELSTLLEIKKFIASNLSQQDIDDILDYFFDRNWLLPFNKNQNIFSIEIEQVNAKWWSDNEYPYLELDLKIVCDMQELVKNFFVSKYIQIVFDPKFSTNEIVLKFLKPFPLLLSYSGAGQLKQYILNFVSTNMTKRDFFIVQFLERQLKKTGLNDWRAHCQWQNANIKITLDNLGKLKQFKGMSTMGKILVGGFVANYLYKRQKAKQVVNALEKFQQKLNNMKRF